MHLPPRALLLGTSSGVAAVLRETSYKDLRELIATAYLSVAEGSAVNPSSAFMRYGPLDAGRRAIALPAATETAVGVKWIASVPENIRHGLPRASGVVILNDPTTGRPYACLEASEINSFRTAVSGVLAAELWLGADAQVSVAVVGAGRIGEAVVRMLLASEMRVSGLTVVDGDRVRAMRFAGRFRAVFGQVAVEDSAEDALASSTLVVFATTARVPHVSATPPLRAGQLVLHLSLRDLQPDTLRRAVNIVDDSDLACSEGTSLALAADRFGRDALRIRPLHEFIAGPAEASPIDDAAVFSPFGMGVLDVAVADYVFRRLQDSGRITASPGFFAA